MTNKAAIVPTTQPCFKSVFTGGKPMSVQFVLDKLRTARRAPAYETNVRRQLAGRRNGAYALDAVAQNRRLAAVARQNDTSTFCIGGSTFDGDVVRLESATTDTRQLDLLLDRTLLCSFVSLRDAATAYIPSRLFHAHRLYVQLKHAVDDAPDLHIVVYYTDVATLDACAQLDSASEWPMGDNRVLVVRTPRCASTIETRD